MSAIYVVVFNFVFMYKLQQKGKKRLKAKKTNEEEKESQITSKKARKIQEEKVEI